MQQAHTQIEAALHLRASGLSLPEIAASLKVNRRTVSKWFAKAKAPEVEALDPTLIPVSIGEGAKVLRSSVLLEIGRARQAAGEGKPVEPVHLLRLAQAVERLAALTGEAVAGEDAAKADDDLAEQLAAIDARIVLLAEHRAYWLWCRWKASGEEPEAPKA